MRKGINIAANLWFSVSGDVTDVWAEGAASGSVVADLLASDRRSDVTNAAKCELEDQRLSHRWDVFLSTQIISFSLRVFPLFIFTLSLTHTFRISS